MLSKYAQTRRPAERSGRTRHGRGEVDLVLRAWFLGLLEQLNLRRQAADTLGPGCSPRHGLQRVLSSARTVSDAPGDFASQRHDETVRTNEIAPDPGQHGH